jgi:hypothetical protein
MHRKAHDIGQQISNTSIAALQKQFLIARQLLSGMNLVLLKDELELDIRMTEYVYAFSMMAMKLRDFYAAVVDLIGTESSHSHQEPNLEYAFDRSYLNTLASMKEQSTSIGNGMSLAAKTRVKT